MKLSQAVKLPLKLGRRICGNLGVMLVASICIVSTDLMRLSFSLRLVEFGEQPSVCSDIDRILDRILRHRR